MTRRRFQTILASALALSMSVTAAYADPPHGKGKGKHGGGDAASTDSPGVTISLGISFDQARRIAVDVGASGYKPLPPGIRKNLARGKALPPGIAKKYAPNAMVSRLPVHPGYEWRVVGTDLVLVAIATAIVVDILSDVFR